MTLSIVDPQHVQHAIRDMPTPLQRQMATLVLAGYTFRYTQQADLPLSPRWWNAFNPQGKFLVAHGSPSLSYVVTRVWDTRAREALTSGRCDGGQHDPR